LSQDLSGVSLVTLHNNQKLKNNPAKLPELAGFSGGSSRLIQSSDRYYSVFISIMMKKLNDLISIGGNKMDCNDFGAIRSEILAGSAQHRKVYLNRLSPVFRSFVHEKSKKKPAEVRKIKVMEKMALDMLYFNLFPKGAEPDKYLNRLFSEIFG
jgi:hypothetical protein